MMQRGIVFKDLKMADMTLENLTFEHCTFQESSFHNIVFKNVSFVDCTFSKISVVNPKSYFSVIEGATFTSCSLIGVSWDHFLGGSHLRRMFDALTDSYLKHNSFMSLDLTSAIMTKNRMDATVFQECTLVNVIFKDTIFDGGGFRGCRLRGADFRDGFGYRINMKDNDVAGAYFSAAGALSLLEEIGIVVD